MGRCFACRSNKASRASEPFCEKRPRKIVGTGPKTGSQGTSDFLAAAEALRVKLDAARVGPVQFRIGRRWCALDVFDQPYACIGDLVARSVVGVARGGPSGGYYRARRAAD